MVVAGISLARKFMLAMSAVCISVKEVETYSY